MNRPDRQRGAIGRVLDGLYLLCGWLAGALMVGICAIMVAMSGGREIGFNIRGGDEIAAWALAAMFGLGLAHTFQHGEVVRVGLLVERFQGRARLIVEGCCLVVGSILTGALAWYCIDLVYDSWRFKERAQGLLPIMIWIPQSLLAFGMTVQFLAFVDQLLRCLQGLKPDYAKDPPKTAEEVMERAAETL